MLSQTGEQSSPSHSSSAAFNGAADSEGAKSQQRGSRSKLEQILSSRRNRHTSFAESLSNPPKQKHEEIVYRLVAVSRALPSMGLSLEHRQELNTHYTKELKVLCGSETESKPIVTGALIMLQNHFVHVVEAPQRVAFKYMQLLHVNKNYIRERELDASTSAINPSDILEPAHIVLLTADSERKFRSLLTRGGPSAPVAMRARKSAPNDNSDETALGESGNGVSNHDKGLLSPVAVAYATAASKIVGYIDRLAEFVPSHASRNEQRNAIEAALNNTRIISQEEIEDALEAVTQPDGIGSGFSPSEWLENVCEVQRAFEIDEWPPKQWAGPSGLMNGKSNAVGTNNGQGIL